MRPRLDARSSLTSWSATSAESAEGHSCFSSSLPVFAGHFPDRPLVPGVYLIATVLELACKALGRHLDIRCVERSKWSAPALPGDHLTVRVQWSHQPEGLRLEGTVVHGETVVASCRLSVVEGLPAPA